MHRSIVLASLCLAAALAGLTACSTGSNNSLFASSYVGDVTESYNCAQSSPPSFVLPNDEFDIVVDSAGNATINIASCPGDTLYGSASGDLLSIPQTNTFTCAQQDAAGDTISITSIGGTLQLDNGVVDVNLGETATIDGDACQGVAQATLN